MSDRASAPQSAAPANALGRAAQALGQAVHATTLGEANALGEAAQANALGEAAQANALGEAAQANALGEAAQANALGEAEDFKLMGVVNVTPDSFSDGGRYLDPQAAAAHGRELVSEGAAILDIGGESTRPGASPVGEDEELRRVLPVIEELSSSGMRARISVDTSKACVARAALDAGATFVNDVTALRGDPQMASVVAESGARCCLMHMLGEPRTMQEDPRYEDVVADVKAFLEQRLAAAVGEGIAEERIVLDPGIGFGKTAIHNLELLDRLGEVVALGRPVMIGASRKSFIGRITGRSQPAHRVAGTVAINVLAYERGARLFRVHDVAPSYDALAMVAATVSGPWTATTRPTSSTT